MGRWKCVFFSLLTVVALMYGQGNEKAVNGKVSGEVFDQQTHTPIQFAEVILLSRSDSALVGGRPLTTTAVSPSTV